MAFPVLRSPDGRIRPLWRFLIASVLAFVCQLLVGLLLRPAGLTSLVTTIAFALVLAINVSLFIAMSLMLDRTTRPLDYIGFSTAVPAARQIVVGFVFGAVLVSIAVIVIALTGTTTFGWRMDGSMALAAATQIVLFAIAALHEEVVFRGYPLQRLTESLGSWPAVIVLSLMFALPHLTNPNSTLFAAFNTAAIGALLAMAYLFTRSLWFVWGIHWGWNLVLAVGYGLIVSGFDTDGPVNGSVNGPDWLTGGAYGIEGGASGSIAIVIGFGVLLWLVRQPALVGLPAPPPSAFVIASEPQSASTSSSLPDSPSSSPPLSSPPSSPE
jgi:membrane protease YdiL (CAAX protease family)